MDWERKDIQTVIHMLVNFQKIDQMDKANIIIIMEIYIEECFQMVLSMVRVFLKHQKVKFIRGNLEMRKNVASAN